MISIASTRDRYRKYETRLKKCAEKTLRLIKKPAAGCAIYLISNQEMRRINRRFAHKDTETNVLSFEEPKEVPHPEYGGKKGAVFLGEVYLAPEYITHHNESLERLLIHGMLHLIGYTHTRRRDKIEMEKKEEEILTHHAPHGYRP